MSEFYSIVADASAILLDFFGDATTFTPRGGAPYALIGVQFFGEAVQAGGVYKTLWAPLSSFAAEPLKGDYVTIGTVQYRVADVKKDSEDGRKLELSVRA